MIEGGIVQIKTFSMRSNDNYKLRGCILNPYVLCVVFAPIESDYRWGLFKGFDKEEVIIHVDAVSGRSIAISSTISRFEFTYKKARILWHALNDHGFETVEQFENHA